MQTSQEHDNSACFYPRYQWTVPDIKTPGMRHFQILKNIGSVLDAGGRQRSSSTMCSETCHGECVTLESSSLTSGGLQIRDALSLDIAAGESTLGLDGSVAREPPCYDSRPNFCFAKQLQAKTWQAWDRNQMAGVIPQLDLKRVLVACAQAVSNADIPQAANLMHMLEQMVSVAGEPIQRLGAYLLEGLGARLELSGSHIYRSLKCDAPMSSDLMTYMVFLYKICPYWRFAYISANVSIREAVKDESRVHIIDFQIAQGSQWIDLIRELADQPGGSPSIRITGIDDPQSSHARASGLDIVGKRLQRVAESCNVRFEFHDAAMDGCEVHLENLGIEEGEAIVVNFPYMLHHMPDESVSTQNHRDRLLRLVKSLSPRIVTLIEQESNTNTKPFHPRFLETMEYYSAMFESIDVACPRNDQQRIRAEQHCVARDIVNVIACEAAERVERHELLGKWRSRFQMAGFSQLSLSSSVTLAVSKLLLQYHRNYRLEERDGGLYLCWKNRAMATSSAWR